MKASNLVESLQAVKAINKKHQKFVNAFLKWDAKYNSLVNHNDANDIEGCRKQENAFSKALDNWEELPKREQSNISKIICTEGY